MDVSLVSRSRILHTLPFTLSILIFTPSINYFLNSIIQYVLGEESVSLYSYLIMAFAGLWGYVVVLLNTVPNRKSVLLFIIVLFLIGGSLISYILYPEIRDDIISSSIFSPVDNHFLTIILYYIPILLVTYNCKDFRYFFEISRIFSLSIVVLAVISYVFISFIGKQFSVLNYMSYSYNLLIGVSFILSFGFFYRKYFYLIVGFLGVIFILIAGSRGALLCVIFYFGFIVFKNTRRLRFNKKVYLVLASLILLFVLVKISDLIYSFENVLFEADLYSRNFSKIIEGDFFLSQSRDQIRQILIDGIWDSPIIGYGLYGDRYIASSHFFDAFAHNIIIEFFTDFGVVFGTFLLVILFYNIYKRFVSIYNVYVMEVFYAILPYGFIQLFFSGSFLYNHIFFMLVGLMFISIKSRNRGSKFVLSQKV